MEVTSTRLSDDQSTSLLKKMFSCEATDLALANLGRHGWYLADIYPEIEI